MSQPLMTDITIGIDQILCDKTAAGFVNAESSFKTHLLVQGYSAAQSALPWITLICFLAGLFISLLYCKSLEKHWMPGSFVEV